MNALLDTNILARINETSHPMHERAQLAVAKILAIVANIYLVPQIIYEFWVVITRPVADNGLGLSVQTAGDCAYDLQDAFEVLDDTPALRTVWQTLVTQFQVIGKSAHDARLVAAMRVHGLDTILTFNKADFERYDGIEVLTPDEVIALNEWSS